MVCSAGGPVQQCSEALGLCALLLYRCTAACCERANRRRVGLTGGYSPDLGESQQCTLIRGDRAEQHHQERVHCTRLLWWPAHRACKIPVESLSMGQEQVLIQNLEQL